MALTEQQLEAIQEDIKDERSKKERIDDQMAALKSVGQFAAETAVEFIPGVSQAIGVKRTSDALEEDDYVGAGIEGTALATSVVPGVGPAIAKGLRKFNKIRKAYKLFVKGEDGELYPLFVDANKPVKQGEFLEANFPDVAFKGKRKEGSKESFYVPTKGAKRTPTKYYLDNKEITKKEYNSLGPNAKSFAKVVPGEKAKSTGESIIIPDEATRKKLIDEGFITEKTKRTKEAPFGRVTAVAARPGWHASQAPVATHLGPQDLKVSKKEAEKLVAEGVTPEAIKRRGNQFYVKRRAEDQVFAEVDMADDVDYQSMLAKEGRSDINDRVPKGGSYKYSDGQADSDQWVVGGDMKVNRVLSREEARAIQKEMGVVDLPYKDEVETILGRKFSKGGVLMDDYIIGKMVDDKTPQKFAKGGLPKQMELFEDGGLKDEGGTVDPVSGNDVPPGSTQEEVRDDIPAQLSEGEFVFPADVVRYIGLENLMSMRQDAKQGLAQMEAMGQMGNSEEATIPDDLPFDIYDLDIEDDEPLEMQVGGYVPGVYTQPSYLSQYGQQVSQVTPSVVSVPSAQQFRPPTYTPPEYKGPTFEDIIPSPTGAYDELRTFVNDEGLIRQIPFIDGKPIYPIPEGFYPQEKAKETIQTPTTVGRTQVTGGDRDEPEAIGTFTTRNEKGEQTTFGVIGGKGTDIASLTDPTTGVSIGLDQETVDNLDKLGIDIEGIRNKTVGVDTTLTPAQTQALKPAIERLEFQRAIKEVEESKEFDEISRMIDPRSMVERARDAVTDAVTGSVRSREYAKGKREIAAGIARGASSKRDREKLTKDVLDRIREAEELGDRPQDDLAPVSRSKEGFDLPDRDSGSTNPGRPGGESGERGAETSEAGKALGRSSGFGGFGSEFNKGGNVTKQKKNSGLASKK